MELLDEALQAAAAASHGSTSVTARPASGSRPVSARSGPEMKTPQVWEAVSSHYFASGPAAACGCAVAVLGNGAEMSTANAYASPPNAVVVQPPVQLPQRSPPLHEQLHQRASEVVHESRQHLERQRENLRPAVSWTRPSEAQNPQPAVSSIPKAAPPVQTFAPAEPIAMLDSRREVAQNVGSSIRERSVASMSSGISSLPAADLHGG